MDLTILGKTVSEVDPDAGTRTWFVKRFPFSLKIIVGTSGAMILVMNYPANQIYSESYVASTDPQQIVNNVEAQMKAMFAETTWFTQ